MPISERSPREQSLHLPSYMNKNTLSRASWKIPVTIEIEETKSFAKIFEPQVHPRTPKEQEEQKLYYRLPQTEFRALEFVERPPLLPKLHLRPHKEEIIAKLLGKPFIDLHCNVLTIDTQKPVIRKHHVEKEQQTSLPTITVASTIDYETDILDKPISITLGTTVHRHKEKSSFEKLPEIEIKEGELAIDMDKAPPQPIKPSIVYTEPVYTSSVSYCNRVSEIEKERLLKSTLKLKSLVVEKIQEQPKKEKKIKPVRLRKPVRRPIPPIQLQKVYHPMTIWHAPKQVPQTPDIEVQYLKEETETKSIPEHFKPLLKAIFRVLESITKIQRKWRQIYRARQSKHTLSAAVMIQRYFRLSRIRNAYLDLRNAQEHFDAQMQHKLMDRIRRMDQYYIKSRIFNDVMKIENPIAKQAPKRALNRDAMYMTKARRTLWVSFERIASLYLNAFQIDPELIKEWTNSEKDSVIKHYARLLLEEMTLSKKHQMNEKERTLLKLTAAALKSPMAYPEDVIFMMKRLRPDTHSY
ncbi:hypothetical protein EDD86DRAFT_206309 [Gorgonomyces haynaldii]|nr:hypothetical protein EDD86DRAFT_206309 [Gorgonomyces haynaldii]